MPLCINDIRVSPLTAPLLQPFRIATGQHNTLDNLLVRLELSDGSCGVGEAAIATHITGETIAQTQKNLDTAFKKLKNHLASDYLKVSAWLNESFPQNKSAVAAIETALFDALSRSLQIPLWKFFGPRCFALKTDITIVIGTLEETVASARAFYRQGFRSFKIKIGRDFDVDIKRVLAVAKIGHRSQIILDANQGFNAKQALSFLKILKSKRIKVDLIEQPVAKLDYEGLKEVQQKSNVPVCADESASSLSDVLHLIKIKAVDAVNIKLMKTGIVHSQEIARVCKAKGIKLMIGGMMESNVAMTAAAHLAAGLGCFDFIDLDTPFFIKDEAKRNPYLSMSGKYDLGPVKVGLGITP